jgi:hypothetical protein
MDQVDQNRSLEELEGEDWGEPPCESHLVTECHRLRRIPLREFTPENLRIMIGQQIGLPYLIPLALELLGADPFAAGDYYTGDLLAAVLRAEAKCWRAHAELRREAAEIAERAFTLLPSLDECDRPITQDALTEAHYAFRRSHTTPA